MIYELVAILPLLAENEQKEAIEKINKLLQEAGASVTGENGILSRGRLAYEVKGVRQGQHLSLFFETASDKLPEIKKSLNLFKNILRYSINKKIKMPVVKEKEKEKSTEIHGWTLKQETTATEASKETVAPAPEKTSKTSLEDIDKKLEEILGGEL